MTTTLQSIQGVLQKLDEDQLRRVLEYAQALGSQDEHDLWRRFGRNQFARAYGDNEPEYSEADVKPELSS
jgi:hypothetical protein